MKTIGRVLRWIIISVVFQFIILSYFNFIYLPGKNIIKASVYEFPGNYERPREIKIPLAADEIKVSYDGSYAGYLLDGNLEIINTKDGKIRKIIYCEKNDLSYFRWLPDRDMVIYSLKQAEKGDSCIEIVTYDLDTGTERRYPKIEKLPVKSNVTAIELSPLTNVVYLKIRAGDSTASIYKFNIMDDLSFVMEIDIDSVIRETNYSDNLIYQDKEGALFVRDGRGNVSRNLGLESRAALLGVDLSDNVYVGELDKQGMVSKVCYGKVNEDPSKSWECLVLGKDVRPEEIIITGSGEIFILEEAQKNICLADGSLEMNYSGDLIQFLDDWLVTRELDTLKLVPRGNSPGNQ
jgi:hypothetical protein